MYRWSWCPALAGACVSAYATYQHLRFRDLGASSGVCEVGGIWSCDAASASAAAEPLGVPLGVFGLLYFIVVGVTAVLARKSDVHRDVLRLQAMAGLAVTIGLAVFSATALKKLCPLCVAVYGCVVALVWTASVRHLRVRRRSLLVAALSGSGIVAGAFALAPLRQRASSFIERQLASEASLTILGSAWSDGIERRAYKPMLLGSEDARVTLYYFVDFTCPLCANLKTMFDRLEQLVPGSYRVHLLHFPMEGACNPVTPDGMHIGACSMARHAHCAAQMGRFATFYENAWTVTSITDPTADLAKLLNVDADELRACVNAPETFAAVSDDVRIASRARVMGTPTVFLGNERLAVQKGAGAVAQAVNRHLHAVANQR